MNSWVEGKLIKKEDGYYIDNELILYNWEDGVLQKGVEWLCKKFKFKAVLELGFGLGWTATEFQKHGIKRHVILEPNKEVYKNASKKEKLHTGYTHQWRKDFASKLKGTVMASCDGMKDYIEATSHGWKPFRVRKKEEPKLKDEII